MKYLIVDDEHALYRQMFADLFSAATQGFEIEEVPRMQIPSVLLPLYNIHFCDRINRHFFLPFKSIWNPFYRLHQYNFSPQEEYCVILLNGSLRYHFSNKYLREFKQCNPNVKLAMILYDSFSNPSAQRSIEMIPLFDVVFSFDEDDCRRHGFERIYSTFSKPESVRKCKDDYSSAFFVGYGQGRLDILQKTFSKISSAIDGCRFMIAGVKEAEQVAIPGVIYNTTIPYEQELQFAYNTECIVEVVREGQTGVSLRTCEAIAFNKKLLTNNKKLLDMPFYDERYMRVFSDPEEIDLSFVKEKALVQYEHSDYFSPINIIRQISWIFGDIAR
ncbi:hypothetical protein [Bacillus sp. X1(2014)]|uniref:glycosyltransferase family protein n=1 Tax=Bacillus sp. X1(2014) TaxID=1565991 RepID=UPI00119C9DA6|nr:hypothetical protein [Bacillus sp. X1(2014)]